MGYQLFQDNNSNSISIFNITDNNTLEKTVSNLDPYTLYTFHIQTAAGEGANQVLSEADSVSVTTSKQFTL